MFSSMLFAGYKVQCPVVNKQFMNTGKGMFDPPMLVDKRSNVDVNSVFFRLSRSP